MAHQNRQERNEPILLIFINSLKYIWLDNLMVEKSADLRKTGILIFGELAKVIEKNTSKLFIDKFQIGSDLGAERIEWMAPGFGPSEGASSSNNSPSPNDFPGHVTFFDEVIKDGRVLYLWSSYPIFS